MSVTDHVEPSPGSGRSFPLSGAIALGSGHDGYVVPDDVDLFSSYLGMSGPLDAFSADHSSSSLTVTIGSGEGFVAGKYVATDEERDVELDADESGQTVAVGWPADQGNEVRVGLEDGPEFSDDSRTLAVWTFDTDGSGVTSATNDRPLGPADVESDFYPSRGEFDDHVDDRSNPHDTTASHVGAPTQSAFDNHTSDADAHHSQTHDNSDHSTAMVEGNYEIQKDGSDGSGIINFITQD